MTILPQLMTTTSTTTTTTTTSIAVMDNSDIINNDNSLRIQLEAEKVVNAMVTLASKSPFTQRDVFDQLVDSNIPYILVR